MIIDADYISALKTRAGVLWLRFPLDITDSDVLLIAEALKSYPDEVRIELSHDIWDSGSPQFAAAVELGRSAGTPGANRYYQGMAWHVWRSTQIWACLQRVLGVDVGTRIKRTYVVGGNRDVQRQALQDVLTDPVWNPYRQSIDVLEEV